MYQTYTATTLITQPELVTKEIVTLVFVTEVCKYAIVTKLL